MGYVASIYFANMKIHKINHWDKGAASINSFSKSIDNKYLFVCDYDGGVAVIDIYSGDLSDDFNIKNARMSVVTFDNQFLIICQYYEDGSGNIEKYSIQSKELVAVLDKHKDYVYSMSCSYDNIFVFLGFDDGTVQIVHIDNFVTI